MEISKRYVLASQNVARRTPAVLQARGLDSQTLRGWYLTTDRDEVWLFAEVNTRRIERLEQYTTLALTHQISTVCDGIPVLVSNSDGLRYCFLLSPRPRLPRSADFPGCSRGLLHLGVGQFGQPLTIRWEDLGHLLVAGDVRMGKSNLLRLIIHQAIAEGSRMFLADISRTTFPMLAEHPALIAPLAETPKQAHTSVAQALAECDHRSILYSAAPGFPDKLEEYNATMLKTGGDPLPRLLVVIDEYNATVVANGGSRGRFIQDVASLCWQGPKFGVNVVVAAQDFEKRIVGRMRDQTNAVCFRVASRELARAVNCAGADRIQAPQKGRAIANRWGLFQVYQFDKTLMLATPTTPLSAVERTMIVWALESNDGYLSLKEIRDHARLTSHAARALALDWQRRGWLEKDNTAGNKRRVTGKLALLADIPQTAQTAQTGVKNDKPTTNRPQTEAENDKPTANRSQTEKGEN
ncbi:MAG: hypothetical protein GY832_34655 [Chloroflexi bacterium]|nr:hypothetical protein [Chloroflexota bacterium]